MHALIIGGGIGGIAFFLQTVITEDFFMTPKDFEHDYLSEHVATMTSYMTR